MYSLFTPTSVTLTVAQDATPMPGVEIELQDQVCSAALAARKEILCFFSCGVRVKICISKAKGTFSLICSRPEDFSTVNCLSAIREVLSPIHTFMNQSLTLFPRGR